jgi:long-chain acyl-CoA synthetase
MYPGQHAVQRADQPAVIMAESGETVTYCELEARSNRLTHLLRAIGLKRLDHYAIFMENHPRYVECCAAGERSGLYFTCINSFLTANELAYIINNSLLKCSSRRGEARGRDWCSAIAPRSSFLVADGAGEGRACAVSAKQRRNFRNANWRRVVGNGDALFVGHHRATQRRAASAARPAAR